MDRPAYPEIPPPALRSDPDSFVQRTEAWIDFQAVGLPQWINAMVTYTDGRAKAALTLRR